MNPRITFCNQVGRALRVPPAPNRFPNSAPRQFTERIQHTESHLFHLLSRSQTNRASENTSVPRGLGAKHIFRAADAGTGSRRKETHIISRVYVSILVQGGPGTSVSPPPLRLSLSLLATNPCYPCLRRRRRRRRELDRRRQ